MEKQMINVLFFVALLVAVDAWRDQAIANAAPPHPSYDCYTIGPSLLACLDYCQTGSNASKPTPECCSALVKVLKENATCFCGVLQYASSYGFSINETRGMMIPPLCGIPHDKLPPAARCNETSPSPSPTPTPTPTPTPPPATPPPSTPPPKTPPTPPPSTPPPSTPPPSTPPPPTPPPSTPPSTNPPPPPSTTPPSIPTPTPGTPAPITPAPVSPSPPKNAKSSGTNSIVPPLVSVFVVMAVALFLVV